MIDPNDTYTLYLDEKTPPDQRPADAHRPALVFRFGTAAELRRLEDKLDALRHLHGREYHAGLKAAIDQFLIKARNLKTPEDKPTDDITETMTLGDLKALAYLIPIRSELSEADRKNSESPSPSSAAASAENANLDKTPAEDA